MINYDISRVKEAVSALDGSGHLGVMGEFIPETLLPDVENSFSSSSAPGFTAAVFNMEKGVRLDLILPYLTRHPALARADVILANELDFGMARSGNLDVTRVIGSTLTMNYAYGVEFITVDAGRCGNLWGLHGNAILSRHKLCEVSLIRLPIEHDWFYMKNESRLGVRMAVLAVIETSRGAMGLCSVHLENRATPEGRARQFEYLLDEIDARLGDKLPVLIGGDMNTNTVSITGHDKGAMDAFYDDMATAIDRLGRVEEYEPLMAFALARGYSYADCNIMNKVTRRKPMYDGGSLPLNLDWFFQRGLICENPVCIKSIFDHASLKGGEPLAGLDGGLLSDHDSITIDIRRPVE